MKSTFKERFAVKIMKLYQLLISVLMMSILSINGMAHSSEYNPALNWVYRDKIRMGWSPDRLSDYQKMADAGMNAVMPRHELDVVAHYDAAQAETPLSENDAQMMALIRD